MFVCVCVKRDDKAICNETEYITYQVQSGESRVSSRMVSWLIKATVRHSSIAWLYFVDYSPRMAAFTGWWPFYPSQYLGLSRETLSLPQRVFRQASENVVMLKSTSGASIRTHHSSIVGIRYTANYSLAWVRPAKIKGTKKVPNLRT